MHRPATGLLSVAAASMLLLACGADPDTPQPSPAQPTQTLAPRTPALLADCLVGGWESVEAAGRLGDNQASVNVAGGAGVLLTVGSDGAAALDFTDMEPVRFAGEQVGGVELAGELFYTGPATGTVRTDTDGQSGNWEPVGPVDWGQVRVTVDLSEPVQLRPFDDLPIDEFAGNTDEWTGELIDIEPVLGESEFECRGEQLLLTGMAPVELTWTFTPR